MSRLFTIILIVFIVYQLKPLIFFNRDSSIRQFGTSTDIYGNKQTLITFHVFIVLLVIGYSRLKL